MENVGFRSELKEQIEQGSSESLKQIAVQVFSRPDSVDCGHELELLITRADHKTLKILANTVFTQAHSQVWNQQRELTKKRLIFNSIPAMDLILSSLDLPPVPRVAHLSLMQRETLLKLKRGHKYGTARSRLRHQPIIDRLYSEAYDSVAPCLIVSVDCFLRSVVLRKKKRDLRIYFLARDGLFGYELAQLLLARFPHRYPGLTSSSLYYVHLNQDTVKSPLASLYLKQTEMDKFKEACFFDLGWFGNISSYLQELTESLKAKYQGLTLAFSPVPENSRIHPIYSLELEREPFGWITGRRSCHFLEDTFSGCFKKAYQLDRDASGRVVPVIETLAYQADEMTKRAWAIRAIKDAATDLKEEQLGHKFTKDLALGLLYSFLNRLEANEACIQEIMVPHESENLKNGLAYPENKS